ncbi:bromodomain adjacent to zinc finger domain protein 1A-like isoform X1 [Varroa destructor]|uniref:Bromodomain adjacent to zinc finger domain protein 1A n=1 Tax=Varroa destructor TaxID=109461 RepID=A0A7M7K2G5_VARDE|nr:bromodomain adjacent to zinc finger domain protein 1A-like isoform X1 [Varroa destructor]
MPILNKEEFERSPPPDDLKPDDPVFYNKLTNEVFTDYDDYFARVILCNSLVWTCSLTGKSGLTFQDAQESEEAARQWVRVFPRVLRRPALFVTDLTSRGRLADLVDDVFNFVKDRFFVGEELDYVYNNKRKGGKILRIHPFTAVPKEQKTDSSNKEKNKKKDSSDLLKVVYDIEDEDSGQKFEVLGKDLYRHKKTFTRDRLKVFLKLATEMRNNVLRVKAPIAEKYKISEVKFHDITVGQLPEFVVSPLKRVSKPVPPKKLQKVKEGKVKEKTNKESNKENKVDSTKVPKKSKKKPDDTPKSDATKKEKISQKKDAEDKLLRTMFMVEWSKPRDDLSVDGLRDLPVATSFDCRIPQEALSDAFLVLEFFSAFTQELGVKDYFLSGLTFDILERAVTETDIIGPLGDIFQILLTNLFKLKEAESQFNYSYTTPSDDQPEAIYQAQKAAGRTMRQIRKVLGFSLPQLTLDKFTLSEVLRLHIESSGAPGVTKKAGSMDAAEDPGLAFSINNPHIVDVLRRCSIFELEIADKLKLLRVIVEQLLCTDGVRDMIEEAVDAHKAARIELRKLRILARPGSGPDDRPQVSPREFDRREQELKQKLRSAQEKIMMAPLGEDRAFRRYYLAYSIPAVIIEDDVVNIGEECIAGGTPKQKMTNHSPAFMKQFLQNYGKDNVSLSMLTALKEVTNSSPEKLSREEHSRLTCTGDQQTCLVHNRNLSRDTWRFVSTREQLDEIIASLDVRGVREKALKIALNADIENLRSAIDRTPLFVLNRNFENSRKTKLPSQFIRDSGLHDVKPSFALELSFREILLGLEERITAGNLGYLKKDRNLWRNRMIEILDAVGEKKTAAEINALQSKAPMSEVIDELCDALIALGHSVEKKVLMAPLGEAEPPSKVKKKKEGPDGLPSIKGNIATWIREMKPNAVPEVNGVHKKKDNITGLADFADSDSKDEESSSEEEDETPKGEGHMLNLPRLFLLMYSLERSVMWTRSIANAACLVCRKKSNPDQMLLCDGCDRGYHLYCLKPPLDAVPQGDWFCSQCAPIPLSPRKRKQAPVDLSSEEEEEEEKENDSEIDENQDVCHACETGGELVLCDSCPRAYHLECCQLKRVPRGPFKCPTCVKGPTRKKTRGSPPATKVKFKSGKNVRRMLDMGVVEDVESFDYNVCSNLLKQLVKLDDAWPFLASVTRKDAPDYHKVIKRPMDFGTLQGKLNDMKYRNNASFISDVLQIFANCCVYNKPRSDVVKAATSLSATFCEMLVQVGLECYIELKDSILEETEESSGWSQGKPRSAQSKTNGNADTDNNDEDDYESEEGSDNENDDEDEEQDNGGEDEDDCDDDDETEDGSKHNNNKIGASNEENDDDNEDDDDEDGEGHEKSADNSEDDVEAEETRDESHDNGGEDEDDEEEDEEDDDDDDDDEDYGSKKTFIAARRKKSSLSSPKSKKDTQRKRIGSAIRTRKRKRGGANDDDEEEEEDSADEDYTPKRRSVSTRRISY